MRSTSAKLLSWRARVDKRCAASGSSSDLEQDFDLSARATDIASSKASRLHLASMLLADAQRDYLSTSTRLKVCFLAGYLCLLEVTEHRGLVFRGEHPSRVVMDKARGWLALSEEDLALAYLLFDWVCDGYYDPATQPPIDVDTATAWGRRLEAAARRATIRLTIADRRKADVPFEDQVEVKKKRR